MEGSLPEPRKYLGCPALLFPQPAPAWWALGSLRTGLGSGEGGSGMFPRGDCP